MVKLKVLVVDESKVYRDLYSKVIEKMKMVKIITTVTSYNSAVSLLKSFKADVVIIDKNISNNQGINLLKEVKEKYPLIEIIMTSYSDDNDFILDTLKYGAVDFVLKPETTNKEKCEKLLNLHYNIIFNQVLIRISKRKIESFNLFNEKDTDDEFKKLVLSKAKEMDKIYYSKCDLKRLKKIDLILIAASTGGPSALEKVITSFSEGLKVPILVVQHMPAGFTKSFSENLNRKADIKVLEGYKGLLVKESTAIIAPGGFHMTVFKKENLVKIIDLEKTKPVNSVIPAADVLFKSVSENFTNYNIITVVLTGMGADGKKGLYELKRRCNCYCITQSEESCVVYGMPRAVYDSGLSDEVLDIDKIGERIIEIVKNRR